MHNDRYKVLEQICDKFGIAILYSFGSRSREVYEWLAGIRAELAPGPSDVDIGVYLPFDAPWSVNQTVLLMVELEDLIGVNRVDLVLLASADPFVAAEVIRGERLYARDANEADEYDLYVLRRAGDLAPLEHERMALIFRTKP